MSPCVGRMRAHSQTTTRYPELVGKHVWLTASSPYFSSKSVSCRKDVTNAGTFFCRPLLLFFLGPVSARRLSRFLFRGSMNSSGRIRTAGRSLQFWCSELLWCLLMSFDSFYLGLVVPIPDKVGLKTIQRTAHTSNFKGRGPQIYFES